MGDKTLQKVDIFISSPGDVGEERRIASEVIEQLNLSPYIADCSKLMPLAYERIVPAAVGETPQRTVDHYMILPDQADIFICILWSRMGTPVIDSDGKEYQSGTEYEFTTAYKANQKSEKPYILLYRSMKNLPIDADLIQVELVRAFFKSFEGKEADLKGLYKKYQNNDEFKEKLHNDLERIISKIIPPVGAEKIAPVPVYTPSELPAYPPQLKEFVTHNRADEITKAMVYLQDHRILLISGIGGVGKTTLARAIIETRPAHVPLPFWFDFDKKKDATLGDVLEKLAAYLKAPDILIKIEGKDADQKYIDRLTGELQRREQLWLVFDNLETILDDRYFHDRGIDLLFTSLRGSTHNAKIIVTSRVLPLLRNGDSLIDILDEKRELKGLKLSFAVDFLIKNGLERVEREKLEELATGVDGHPLALKLLIELVKKYGVSDTLNDLSMYQKRKENTIKKAKKLFKKLAGDEKEFLERISVFRKPETMNAIKAMFTERTSEDAVEKLMDKSLLEIDHKGSYWLHPLIREFSYDDLKNKKEIHQLAFSYYQSFELPEKRTKKDDVQPLIEACYHACKAEKYDEAAGIIFDKNLHEDLDRWGESRTLVELYAGVLPKDPLLDKPLLNDIKTHSRILGNLGIAYRHLGQVEKAIQYYEKALAIAQEIGNRKGEGADLGNLGLAYYSLGQVEKAIQYYEKALAIDKEIGDRRGEGTGLNNLGAVFQNEKKYREALACYLLAKDIHTQIKDPNLETTESNLNNLREELGEKEYEKFVKEVAPRAEEIVRELLK